MPSCDFGVCAFGRQCVQGTGNPAARILLLGEAPGAQELKYKVPFVGRAGKLLDQCLEDAGMERVDLYITNTTGCVDMTRDDKRPLPAEIDACRPRLLREIEMVSPAVVLCMGNTAISYFFPGYRIGEVYGSARATGERIYVASYHPAAALRNPHLTPIVVDALRTARRLAYR